MIASLLHTAATRRLILVCALLAVSALAAYAVFPAVGAQVAFASRFPGGTNRNFMPSLHTGWGIALLLAAWPLGKYWRCGALLYLLPMLLYALASHYLCDLIVAVPWTLACWYVLKKGWGRVAAYLAIAAGWMLLIRFGLPVFYVSLAIPWLLVAATLATPALMAMRFASLTPVAVPESDQA